MNYDEYAPRKQLSDSSDLGEISGHLHEFEYSHIPINSYRSGIGMPSSEIHPDMCIPQVDFRNSTNYGNFHGALNNSRYQKQPAQYRSLSNFHCDHVDSMYSDQGFVATPPYARIHKNLDSSHNRQLVNPGMQNQRLEPLPQYMSHHRDFNTMSQSNISTFRKLRQKKESTVQHVNNISYNQNSGQSIFAKKILAARPNSLLQKKIDANLPSNINTRPSYVNQLPQPDRVKFQRTIARDTSLGLSSKIECSSPTHSIDVASEDPIASPTLEGEFMEKEEEGVFQEFERWLLDNGAVFPSLYLKAYSDDVRGVHANRHIDSYQTILSIPVQCLITDHMGRTETNLGHRVFNSDCNLSTPNLIAVILYIMSTRRDPNHFFQPYYRILPKTYSNFPIFWDDSRLAWLEGSPLLQDIEERKRNMRADYDELCRVCPDFREYSFREFLEVRTAVGSRNFGIVIGGEKRTAMVPFADMLNHFRPRETSWTYENSKDAFTITSISPIQPGQQVMDSYGKKCNSKFFLHYGFAVERNREDDGKCQNELVLSIAAHSAGPQYRARRSYFNSSVGLSPESSLESGSSKHNETSSLPSDNTLRGLSTQENIAERKVAVLSDVFGLVIHGGLYVSKRFRLSMNYEDRSTCDALGFLRAKVADEDELGNIVAAEKSFSPRHIPDVYMSKHRESLIPFVSRFNEAKALEKLAAYCAQHLKKYPSTYEENLELLKSGHVKPFSDRRTALVVILGEQEICKFWIFAAKMLCPVLRLSSQLKHEIVPRLLGFPKITDRDRDLTRYAFFLAEKIRLSH